MSDKTLVIVESPGKIKKIEEYLGSNFIVRASYGHCLDLDSKELSIDVENNFEPKYIITPDKKKTVIDLQHLARQCKEVIIASDEDREGEKIGADLAKVLKLKDPKRIVFHEITKKAIENAVKNPSKINYDMVYAQQARRLLDRLVGYKISPILWNMMNKAKSAGRVQSVVVKIICDREKEIKDSIINPYFKTIGTFLIKKNKTSANLYNKDNKELYKFNSYDEAKMWINLIGENTTFKVKDIENKIIDRNPAPPFITSTLQQDASSKLRFNVKKTMEIAQKLYEAGHITYMRTDSTNLSEEARKCCKKYIVDHYGEKYSRMMNYTKNSKTAQEAHEAIRPTRIDIKDIKNMTSDCIKLYNLIWKRTIASQMSSARINVMNISIDGINYPENKSILPKKSLFKTTLENILFDGFLIIYNDKIKFDGVENENNDEENNNLNKTIKLKVDDEVKFRNMSINEEYSKPPLRYNEPGLIKFLEKNSIGRPSTYASIISKVIDRNYVRIGNVDGIEKKSKTINLDSKYKIKEKERIISIGSEKNKMIGTETGIKLNEFMIENFPEIMDLKYTAKFEKYLDKIASGKAKWYNILQKYYDNFNPVVEKLKEKSAEMKQNGLDNNDILLGIDPETKFPIYKGKGKYGPYLKTMDIKDSNKWKYTSISDEEYDNIKLESAIDHLIIPKTLGKIDKSIVTLMKGRYGLYLKVGNKNFGIDKDIDIKTFDIDQAKLIINNVKDPYAIKSFKYKNKTINIRDGKYGPYIMIQGKNRKNIPIPDDVDIENIDLETILGIIAYNNSKNIKKK